MCTEGGPTSTGEGKTDTTGQESISECVQRVVQLLQEKVRQILLGRRASVNVYRGWSNFYRRR